MDVLYLNSNKTQDSKGMARVSYKIVISKQHIVIQKTLLKAKNKTTRIINI